jgi:hypothetical protein
MHVSATICPKARWRYIEALNRWADEAKACMSGYKPALSVTHALPAHVRNPAQDAFDLRMPGQHSSRDCLLSILGDWHLNRWRPGVAPAAA